MYSFVYDFAKSRQYPKVILNGNFIGTPAEYIAKLIVFSLHGEKMSIKA